MLWAEEACKLGAVDGVTSVLSARAQTETTCVRQDLTINENTTTVLKQERVNRRSLCTFLASSMSNPNLFSVGKAAITIDL